MEEINHLSHEHPLVLIENTQMIVGDDNKEIVCCWCQKLISNGFAYGCIMCHYFLHKKCAQLGPVINHHLHFQHPLILGPGSESWYCDVCDDQDLVRGFRYNCLLCDFDACTKCGVAEVALKEEASVKFEHEGHPQHTLTLQLRPAAFCCDACKTEDKDFFYQCNDCTFWIHKTCATLALNIHLPQHHHHPLRLAYSLPYNFYNFRYYCEFCKQTIRRSYWVYHCANCRYFAHIKCALNAYQQPLTSRDDPGTTSNAQEQTNDHDFLHFPMSEAFTEPLKQLYLESETPNDDDGAAEIDHWSHNHPLKLNVEPQSDVTLDINHGDPIVVCNGCVRPLTLPYYSCKDGCGFFLHRYCTELPRTLDHKLHKDHSLDLIVIEDQKNERYECDGCFTDGNTFVYKCETCTFHLDVNCAFLPNTIKHESHEHPLVQGVSSRLRCYGCHLFFEGISYLCRECDFQLDMYCAMRSPYSLAHRYCKGHHVPLTYPPVEDHLEDFYCTICEVEMHPKFWLYHCQKCDNSFHLDCIEETDSFYENCKLEGTLSVFYHKHPLTYARRKKTPRYVCFSCNHDINGRLILECRTGTCPFRICVPCHDAKTLQT